MESNSILTDSELTGKLIVHRLLEVREKKLNLNHVGKKRKHIQLTLCHVNKKKILITLAQKILIKHNVLRYYYCTNQATCDENSCYKNYYILSSILYRASDFYLQSLILLQS